MLILKKKKLGLNGNNEIYELGESDTYQHIMAKYHWIGKREINTRKERSLWNSKLKK